MNEKLNPNEDHHYDLNHLARESWQLELLVSGIILLLLFSSDDWSASVEASAEAWTKGGLTSLFGILLSGIPIAIMISKVFFIIHVVVRGLWIGALGLRSVSGDIQLDRLKLQKWFGKFLHPYNDSFDQYIFRLERFASVIFSFNFLLIFYIFSILLSIGWISFFGILSGVVHWSFDIIVVFLSFALFLNLIDFISLQRLKRGKFGFLYYPFYRVLNTLNLSFLYRSLHYNFVDSTYTRKIIKGLIYFAISIILINGISFNLSPWLNRISPSSKYVYQTINYGEDLSNHYVQRSFLSEFENTNLLKLTTPFRQSDRFQKYLFSVCPELEEFNSLSWYSFNGNNGNLVISNASERADQNEIEDLLDCYRLSRSFRIDEVAIKPEHLMFLFNDDFRSPRALQYFFPLDSFNVGLHNLEIKTFYMRDDSVLQQAQNIAFYKVR